MHVYLRQLQGPHDSSETEHVAHGALELGGDLDDFVQQTGPLLGRPGAAQHIHSQHGRHGLEPAGGRREGRLSFQYHAAGWTWLSICAED